MFKSKHSGWTFAGTRTPFGGGGDIFQSVGKTISKADPHVTEGVGDYLSENGWMIPLAMITAGAGAALGGAVTAGEVVGEGAVAGAGGATAADGTVFAAGSTIPAGTTMAEGTVVAGETGAAGGASAVTATPGADAVLGSSTNIADLTPAGAGNFGTITPAGGATGAGGLTGGMSAGTMVGDGTLGTTIGQSYMAAGPGQFAVNAAGNAIPAGAAGIAGTVPSGISASDALTNANRARNLSKLLSQGAASGLSSSLGQLAQGANPQGQALGAVVRGNQNPFAFTPQQPIQDAKPLDLASLSKLLKQG
jgi:hypothetical protein